MTRGGHNGPSVNCYVLEVYLMVYLKRTVVCTPTSSTQRIQMCVIFVLVGVQKSFLPCAESSSQHILKPCRLECMHRAENCDN